MGDNDLEKIFSSFRVRSLLMMATFAASAYWLYQSNYNPFSGDKKDSSQDKGNASKNSKVDNIAHEVRPSSARMLLEGDKENSSADDQAKASERSKEEIVADRVRPAVVHISLPGGWDGGKASEKIGCGVIFDKDGFILTSAYGVANKPEEKVIVRLASEQTLEGTVIIVRKDEDYAIVKINPHSQLPTAKFSSSSGLHPGQRVIAMGFETTSSCTVRSKSRKCRDFGPMFGRNFLVISASTTVENSGGPLANMDGKIVGIRLHKVYNADQSYILPIDRVSASIRATVLEWKDEEDFLNLKMDNISPTDSNNVKNQKLNIDELKINDMIQGKEKAQA